MVIFLISLFKHDTEQVKGYKQQQMVGYPGPFLS